MEQIGNTSAHQAIRLGDLRHWHVITARCARYGHKGRLDVTALGRGNSDHTRLMDAARRVRCGSCGNHTGNRLLVTMNSRD